MLDATLKLHGAPSGFFLGDTYSVAEVYCTGFLQRALVTLPAYRGVDLAALVKDNGLDRCVMGGGACRPDSLVCMLGTDTLGRHFQCIALLASTPRPACASPPARRFASWMEAALARPSAQQTKPDDEVIVEAMRKFLSPFHE